MHCRASDSFWDGGNEIQIQIIDHKPLTSTKGSLQCKPNQPFLLLKAEIQLFYHVIQEKSTRSVWN